MTSRPKTKTWGNDAGWDIGEDELAALKAIDLEKVRLGTKFLTVTQILAVLKRMGWKKAISE